MESTSAVLPDRRDTYMRGAKYNIERLAQKSDTFFIRMDSEMLLIIPAGLVYRRNLFPHEIFMDVKQTSEPRTFILSITERDGSRITGSLYETGLDFMQGNIRENSFFFTHCDAEMEDGSHRHITLEEWNSMDRYDRERFKSGYTFYDPADEAKLAAHLLDICSACEENGRSVTAEDFLVSLNASYMARARNPQPDMLRVDLNAAKEILES